MTSKDLIAQYVGQTAEKTAQQIERSLGGIFFIDEAYSLCDSGFGKDAMPVLLTKLLDYKGRFVSIAAGYPKEMKQWLATNSGGCSGDVLAICIQDDFKPIIAPKFLYYLLSSDEFFSYNLQHAKGAKMPRGDKSAILGYKIPIPCPENPKKSLEIQAEIVRILDAFTELTAELTARKKQYEYYRDLLFSFPKPQGVA